MQTITRKFLKETGACSEGACYAIHNLLDKPYYEAIKHLIKDERLQWANWLVTRVLDKQNKARYAIYAAKQVLKIFEDKYPDDKRPREATKAAKRWIKNPNEENRVAAADAASYAYAAVYAAYAYAASDAAFYSAYAAIYSSYTAVYAADASYAAIYAAAAAAYAADAAACAASCAATMRIKILRYGLGLLLKQDKESTK